MELLVATLAHTVLGNDVDGLARLRLISDTVRNAPGLVNARFYRSREPESYYFMLTTWEDEEFWYKAQWLMHYLWGYSRPSAQSPIAAAHIVTVRPDQADRVERGWVEELRRQTTQLTLAFAFLARGRNEDALFPHDASILNNNKATEGAADKYSSNFLNLLSWPGEVQRRNFYADQNYKAISGFLSSLGVVRILELDPV